MLRSGRLLVSVAVIVGALIVPFASHADHEPGCTGEVPNECSTTFSLSGETSVSVQAARFDELLVDGEVTLKWFDSKNILIFEWICPYSTSVAGTSANTITPLCSYTQHASGYFEGTQTLRVAAVTYVSICDGACTFHGSISFEH